MSATMHSARDTTRGDGAQTPLAKLRHGPATLGGSGRTAGGLPLVVHAHHLRPLRQGADGQRGEAHLKRSDMLIRDIIARMRHDGCGGKARKVELLTGIEDASSRPVRRIVLI